MDTSKVYSLTDESESGADLLERARSGDQRAFAMLVEQHRDRLWAICLRITGNQHDAEDALQDALVAAWRAIGSFRGDAQLSTWLYRIGSNAALARIRKRSDADDIDDHDPVSSLDVAQQVVVSDRIQEALSQVPDAYRATFVLRVYGELSYSEIAEAQGIGLQTVRSRISRARSILSELLADLR
ncbi:RNA polymerase sigma factor [Gordonia sp. C13]|uniref:RNA polymerase sigma factor n=1 Tax=Gordonia sp. C13 TaxID=2935078 RepID=UPI00200A0A86|nr:sigma-70 family RNA polymerase sigma factor [Gordonia sp. C13]MCK8616166.1 sigma-70 family RNA polymerase sigma factor [Gordonia sp. C13]